MKSKTTGNSLTKELVLLSFFLLVAGCVSNTGGSNSSAETNRPTSTTAHLTAVYFIQGQAELTSQDLGPYPEIMVVQTFDKFKQYANRKIALWIDKGATPLTPEQQEWMNEAPQAYYPIILVGSGNPLHSFRDLLVLQRNVAHQGAE